MPEKATYPLLELVMRTLGRRTMVMGAVGLFTTFLSLAMGVKAQSAPTARFFIVQSTGLFEIQPNRQPPAGGRFVVQPTGESISVPGLGNQPVRGYTDRGMRGEQFVAYAQGSGNATIRVTAQRENGQVFDVLPTRPISLPLMVGPFAIPNDPNWDFPTAHLSQNGRTISRRFPLGRRP